MNKPAQWQSGDPCSSELMWKLVCLAWVCVYVCKQFGNPFSLERHQSNTRSYCLFQNPLLLLILLFFFSNLPIASLHSFACDNILSFELCHFCLSAAKNPQFFNVRSLKKSLPLHISSPLFPLCPPWMKGEMSRWWINGWQVDREKSVSREVWRLAYPLMEA